jgi:hypothetical protein
MAMAMARRIVLYGVLLNSLIHDLIYRNIVNPFISALTNVVTIHYF